MTPQFRPYLQVQYWGLRASPTLDEAIAVASASLRPFEKLIEAAKLQVGRWSQHQNQGHTYRVTLTVECVGGGAVDFEDESDIDAQASLGEELLANVFKRAASRLHG